MSTLQLLKIGIKCNTFATRDSPNQQRIDSGQPTPRAIIPHGDRNHAYIMVFKASFEKHLRVRTTHPLHTASQIVKPSLALLASKMNHAPVKQVYREILKLVKQLPPASRGYYTQYARENFVTYSEVQEQATVWSLLERAHHHSCWILNKYGVDEAAANRLKQICLTENRVPAPA